MIFISDRKFFDDIGEQETKRYFKESYKFICNYKKLGEENDIDKICARDFWKGRDSYRNFQNEFYNYITEKSFKLKRGMHVEETGARNLRIEELKQITNFENTKKVLDNIKLELPEIPDISDIKIIKLNREKVEDEIIKPKDKLINDLYQENKNLYKELSKQVNLVDKATKYEKENNVLLDVEKQVKREEMEKELDLEL